MKNLKRDLNLKVSKQPRLKTILENKKNAEAFMSLCNKLQYIPDIQDYSASLAKYDIASSSSSEADALDTDSTVSTTGVDA